MVELDAKYEGIAVGSRLLISQSDSNTQPGSNTLVTVISVSQGQATFPANNPTTPVQDTVTLLTLSPLSLSSMTGAPR